MPTWRAAQVAVVEGAVVGGGLTVIANAPNPAGQALLAPLLRQRRQPHLAVRRRARADPGRAGHVHDLKPRQKAAASFLAAAFVCVVDSFLEPDPAAELHLPPRPEVVALPLPEGRVGHERDVVARDLAGVERPASPARSR